MEELLSSIHHLLFTIYLYFIFLCGAGERGFRVPSAACPVVRLELPAAVERPVALARFQRCLCRARRRYYDKATWVQVALRGQILTCALAQSLGLSSAASTPRID